MSAGGEHLESDPAAAPSPQAARDADADLLLRLAAGGRGTALGELTERYAARLYDIGLTTLGDRDLAAALAAETVAAVASRAGEFDPDEDGSAREFILSIAHERAADLAASRPEAERDGPEDVDFERAVADAEFRAAVASLGDEGRGVLEAILGEGLTRAEAGERLGLTVGIVEVRLRTALRAVRDELDARGVPADATR